MGEEAFYIDKLTEAFEKHVLNESEKSFNQTIVYGREITGSQLVGVVKRFPMMSEFQFVLVKEAQQMKEMEPLLGYLANPLSSTVLVMAWKGGKPDKRGKFFKAWEKHQVFESEEIYDYQLEDWIRDYATEVNLKFDPKAITLMAFHSGTDLTTITREIDKLLINKPAGSLITEHDIETYVGISREFNMFELQGAIARKNTVLAIKILSFFGNNRQDDSIIPVISTLYGFFSKLWMLVQDGQSSEQHLASRYNIRFPASKDFVAAMNHYSLPQTESALRVLHEYDLKSKGIGNNATKDSGLALEMVLRIIQP